jgi:hypothetical protein
MKGFVTLCNFSPNNWESHACKEQIIHVTWAKDGLWFSKSLGSLEPEKFLTICSDDIESIVPDDSIVLFSLAHAPLPLASPFLPELDSCCATFPMWRATLGLSSGSYEQTSYQGEIDPFPPNGTLLTFGPFMQFGRDINNYLILLNIESSPVIRLAELEIYDSAEMKFKGRFSVRNNAVTSISLNELGFKEDDLPLFICREMAFIPLYFSKTLNGAYLSLEHTHPPASLVVHGKRWEAQKFLKRRWFERASQLDSL